MTKRINYNYIILFYDVGEKRVQKVFKICKKYLSHFQLSVFRGEISQANIIRLKNELSSVIDKEKDFISMVEMIGISAFHEETIGTSKIECQDGNLFI